MLLLGPLYHLPSAPDRALALSEAVRCARPAGVVVATAMSRWAKPAVRASRGELGDPAVRGHLLRVLAHGRDAEGDAFDLVSYHHDPQELHEELVAAGLVDVLVLGVEGPLGAEARRDVSLADTALAAARTAEARAPQLSIHLLARAIRRPDADAGRPTR